MKKIAVLVSNKGTGSNLRALSDAGFDIGLVIADREEAAGIQIAREKGLKIQVLPYLLPNVLDSGQARMTSKNEYRDEYSLNLAKVLSENEIEIAVLAGFNRILTKPYFEKFEGQTINIHPGAIPETEGGSFIYEGEVIPWNQGTMTDKAVANFLGLKNASSTIHIVTEKADFGPILKRVFVPVRKTDTIETLYLRLKHAENEGLVEVLKGL